MVGGYATSTELLQRFFSPRPLKDLVVTADCYAYNEEAECMNTRSANIAQIDREKWCNPMIGKQDLDFSQADRDFDRVVKGGNYDTSKWCEASPRARFSARSAIHASARPSG